jgi:hypothetical protein
MQSIICAGVVIFPLFQVEHFVGEFKEISLQTINVSLIVRKEMIGTFIYFQLTILRCFHPSLLGISMILAAINE